MVKFVPVHAMKAYGGEEVQRHAMPDLSTGKKSSTQCTQVWVGSRASLDIFENKNFLSSYQESTLQCWLGCPVHTCNLSSAAGISGPYGHECS
jgi:hypothetical protein